jgi:succinate dehydrogenase/fumarate reductase flavoprotein subunit
MSKITRREFVKGTVVGTAALAGASALAGCSQAGPMASGMPEEWDKEADVVVVGYGGAGAATAMTAHDEGAEVLIIEKQTEENHTSNTQMCAGVFVSPSSKEEAIAYMSVASLVNVDMPESQDLPDDVIDVWAEYMSQNKQWFEDMGVENFNVFADQGRDPDWPGNDAIKAYQLMKEDGSPGVGNYFFDFLAEQVDAREIEVMWGTPGKHLITNTEGEVVGVVAEGPDGEINIKAKKAVVLTTGGFEFDEDANKTYLPTYPMVFYGNPDNTGDGIRMAQEVGADLWHMTVLGGGFKVKFPDFPTAFGIAMGTGSYVVTNKYGERFKAENALGGYSGYWNAVVYDTVEYTWPRIPSYWIFDEELRTAGPIVYTFFGAAGPVGMYEWSSDNSKEIENGWIIKADTIAELAEKLEMDPEVLEAEITQFNEYAETGEDAEFGRPADHMAPLSTPPFYAVKLWPGLNNTFGGPRRDATAHIVDVNGDPIPRLYSAGELGSIYVQYPQGGANVGECVAFGRIAGENAAAEESWE